MTVCAGTVIDGSDTSCATIGDTGGDSDIAGDDIAGERFNDKPSTATNESDGRCCVCASWKDVDVDDDDVDNDRDEASADVVVVVVVTIGGDVNSSSNT